MTNINTSELVKRLIVKSSEAQQAIEAVHYSQAALNAANALLTLREVERSKVPGISKLEPEVQG